MGQRSVPAPFLMKTYELVEDEETVDVISWGEDGTTFIVWNIAEFAKDLLPKYFKHNNFSSFVRQLNTYGFRKIVPDKWEFANENFKRDDKSLLTEIRRRKTTQAGKTVAGVNNVSHSLSGEDGGSISTSSPSMVLEVADLSGENEKLRRDNEILSSELAQTKKQCDVLTAFLTTRLNVGRDQVNQILRRGLVGKDDDENDNKDNDNNNDNDEENKDDNDGDGSVNEMKKIEEEGLKLFGVWLKEVDGIESGRKRGRCGDIKVDSENSNINSNNNNNNMGLNGPNCGIKFMRTR